MTREVVLMLALAGLSLLAGAAGLAYGLAFREVLAERSVAVIRGRYQDRADDPSYMRLLREALGLARASAKERSEHAYMVGASGLTLGVFLILWARDKRTLRLSVGSAKGGGSGAS